MHVEILTVTPCVGAVSLGAAVLTGSYMYIYIYIKKHGILFKQKNNKKHVEIHTAGVGDTVSCDWESVEVPVCRGLSVFVCPIVLTGSYIYICIYKTRYISHTCKIKKIKG